MTKREFEARVKALLGRVVKKRPPKVRKVKVKEHWRRLPDRR